MTFSQAIHIARQGDPTYLTAHANLMAAGGRVDQAFGPLMPQLSASINTNRNHRDYETMNNLLSPTNDGYNGRGAQLNVTVPLFRRTNWIALEQAHTAVAQMRRQLAAADQDLLVRLGQAWFDLMTARDALLVAEGQSAAMRNQWEQYAHAEKIGLAGATVAEEARFKYDQAVAEQLAAESEQQVKLAALEQIVGVQPGLQPLFLSDRYAPDMQRAMLQRRTLAQWLEGAELDSPMILAARRGFDAANDEIRKQQAGHDPTIDLVGSFGSNGQHAGSFPGQDGYRIRNRALGLQINIPLSSGGAQSGKVTEAVGLREKARQELELARRNVRSSAKQAWFGWQAGEARRAASLQAIRFGRLGLDATREGERSELKSALDVLQARQQLLSGLRDLQRAHYEMITSQFKLLASAGRLRAEDLTALDPFLTGKPAEAALLREVRLVPAAPAQ